MSARNYYQRNISCLPDIGKKKVPRNTDHISDNSNVYMNRNIYSKITTQPLYVNNPSRIPTPFYDFISESDTASGTPDFRSEESDSSTGSILDRANAEASKALADEWECIERTIYDEEGDKVTRPQLLEECKQWQELFPHLRIVGKQVPIPEKKQCYRNIEEEDIIAVHYSDYEQFSESEERLSESSDSEKTPKNSPRDAADHYNYIHKLDREKNIFKFCLNKDGAGLPDSFHSMLQITPLYPRSPPSRSVIEKRHYSSILKSEISSSKWLRKNSPESSLINLNYDRGSAKSFVSLDTKKYGSVALSANERKKVLNGTRLYTARQRENTKLQPLYAQQSMVMGDGHRKPNSGNQLIRNRKVSLPPLQVKEEKQKTKSAKRNPSLKSKRSAMSKSFYQLPVDQDDKKSSENILNIVINH